ncbi:MAG: GIY-YIG nuclease family protein [Gammaproteobacteria bacterium]
MTEWQVYILECADGSLYTGIARNLDERIAAHNNGTGAKYTRGRRPVKLVYQENATSRSIALRREITIKKLPRADKLRLAESG